MVVERIANFVGGKIKRKAESEADKAIQNLGRDNDIMLGLVPTNLGGLLPDKGFYITPETPADPTDCARYPDSPFCGGMPLTLTPIGIEPEIINDGCNIGIKLNPALAWIRLPPVAFVYRKPECRSPSKQNLPEQSGGIPAPLVSACNSINGYDADGLSRNGYTAVLILCNYWNHNNVSTTGSRRKTEKIEVEAFKTLYKSSPPFSLSATAALQFYPDYLPLFCIRLKYTSSVTTEGQATESIERTDELIFSGDFGKTQEADSPRFLSNSLIDEERVIGYIYINEHTKAEQQISRLKSHTTVTNYIAQGGGSGGSLTEEENWQIYVECGLQPPPPPYDPCLMTKCCPCDDTLNKLIIKKLKNLEKVIGVDEYPASLPKSLISKDEGFIGNLIPNGNDEIPNLTQLLAKFIKYYDELMGQWELAIEVKDSDPSTPGDQPVGIKLPNMAEAMGELFTLMFQTHINSETLLNIVTRNLIETGADKQQNFISYKLIQAISDYLGFKQKEIKAEMPLSFTPSYTRYDSLLQESKVKVNVVEMDEKFGLEADLMKLRKIASILDSVYFRKLDPNSDIKSQILSHLLKSKNEVDKINDEDTSKTEWEAFLRQVEEGYGQMGGVTDPTKPYGREYAERPKIRDLTDIEPPQP